MANCPKCGKELKAGAKFCGGCGTKIDAVAASADNAVKCPKCGAPLKPGKKFCGACGTKIEEAAPAPAASSNTAPAAQSKDFSLIANYIRWNMLEGQIAVKIDENDIAAYGKVKGLSVQEGVRAIIFVGGKLITELSAGSYAFKDFGASDFEPEVVKKEVVPEAAQEKARPKGFFSRIGGFFSNIAGALTGRNRERAEAAGLTSRVSANVPPVTIVLIRDVKFPLVFNFKNIATANLNSEVGLHLLCQVANLNDFYKAQLLDKKFVCYDQFSKDLDLVIENILNVQLSNVSPTQVSGNLALNAAILPQVQAAVQNIYPYINVVNVLNLTAKNEELAAIRRMKDELYVSEQELTHLQHRNDFLNRMQDVNNAQALHEARTKVDFIAAMDKIDQQNELNQFEREKFAQMLMGERQIHEARSNEELAAALQEIEKSGMLREDEMAAFKTNLFAQRILREAKSEDMVEATLQEYKKNGLLREEEIETLEHNIEHRRDLRDINDTHILNMATLNNEREEERLKLMWEFEVGTKRLENELQLQNMRSANEAITAQHEVNASRIRDDYSDERRDKDAAFADNRRRSEMELDKQEQQNQLDLLRQAQALRQEREDAEHRREQESLAAARAHEAQMASQEQKHDEEMRRIFAGMTVEQIMAANPDITPEAANALAQRYSTAQKDELIAARQADQDKMMAFMQQQMAAMQQMAMAGMGVKADFQQQMMAAKQAELDRTRADANANQDRFLAGMQTTIQSVGGAMNAPQQVYMQQPAQPQYAQAQPAPQQFAQAAPMAAPVQEQKAAPAARVCKSCGAALEEGALFCDECGVSV